MSRLIRMRLLAYVRTQVAFAPLFAAGAVLAVVYGGGSAAPAEAYGLSAIVLFPVLAWQVKILLDVEPDVQRRIAATAIGSRQQEVVAGLLAGALTAPTTVVIALVLPWLVGGIALGAGRGATDLSLPAALGAGLWVHVLAIPPAVALGALASRPVTRTAGNGIAVLVSGVVLAIVLGLKSSPVPWLMPPLMRASRQINAGLGAEDLMLITVWAFAWAAIVLFGYFRLRRTRP